MCSLFLFIVRCQAVSTDYTHGSKLFLIVILILRLVFHLWLVAATLSEEVYILIMCTQGCILYTFPLAFVREMHLWSNHTRIQTFLPTKSSLGIGWQQKLIVLSYLTVGKIVIYFNPYLFWVVLEHSKPAWSTQGHVDRQNSCIETNNRSILYEMAFYLLFNAAFTHSP